MVNQPCHVCGKPTTRIQSGETRHPHLICNPCHQKYKERNEKLKGWVIIG